MLINVHKTKKGFSLIEMLIYIGLISAILITIIFIIVNFSTQYRTVALSRAVERSAISTLERLTRDIRSATSTNSSLSLFDSSPGYITLNVASTTEKFYVSSGALKLDVAGVYYGPLTGSDITVLSLIFRQATTSSTTNAVRVDMTLQASHGSTTVSKNYHATIIMRGL